MWQQAKETGVRLIRASASIRQICGVAATTANTTASVRPRPTTATKAPTGAAAAAAAAAVVGLGAVCLSSPPATSEAARQAPQPQRMQQRQHDQFLGRYTISDAAEKCAPSVVNITCGSYNSAYFTPNNPLPFGMTGGSGFILTADGIIVTNAHVAAVRGPLVVTLATGEKYAATVKAMDEQCDVALLKIDVPHPLPPATLGKSSTLRAGEYVIALGSPLFLQNSLTLGIVSAVARPGSDMGLRQKGDYIQTDAAINLGNSGGPLISLDGEVIGINTFKAANSDGISFAIPIDVARAVIGQLLSTGRVARPYLGLRMVTVDRALYDSDFAHDQRAKHSNGDGYVDPESGLAVMVVAVSPDSPAARAGLQPYDLILDFGAKPARTTTDVHNVIGLEVGKRIPVTVKRDSKLVDVVVVSEAEQVHFGGIDQRL
ncbi:trypsin-like cysteine/serine peptidase domain-containing protein [Tribonema minus]|uniref:Trypsin-like cysteine/serine peptidase domain-containing protein n=1 Tax=Tribonema minus TaxID=303371 RepID=A0A835ZCW5_9STRA|nr:trypsin-like cysteine/serine peptidase domain-containing protein [Tribonema minus]